MLNIFSKASYYHLHQELTVLWRPAPRPLVLHQAGNVCVATEITSEPITVSKNRYKKNIYANKTVISMKAMQKRLFASIFREIVEVQLDVADEICKTNFVPRGEETV